MNELHRYATLADASHALARVIESELTGLLRNQPLVTLMVPGGNTPRLFLEDLFARNLDWSRVLLSLSDERQVEETSGYANRARVRAMLLKSPARLAQLTWPGDPALPQVLAWGAFDLAILGMGKDGHVASLFPDQPVDEPGGEAVLEVTPDPLPAEAPFPRWSWSMTTLCRSRRIVLLVSGQEKLQVLENVESGMTPRLLPVAKLFEGAKDRISIFWSRDE